MKKQEIQQLYVSQIIPESRNMMYFRDKLEGDLISAYNPLCGDKYKIQLDISDGLIEKVLFTGHGCALSRASASVMAGFLTGLSLNEAKDKIHNFLQKVSEGGYMDDIPEAMSVLLSLRNFDGRSDCITLAWQALKNIDQYD
jgi:nitrogen fixation NifU-like protein